jgi:predicted transposase YdaD
MLGLSDLKKTRVYQDALQEGERNEKLATIARLMGMGLTVAQVAQAVELPIEDVQNIAQQQANETAGE